MTINLDYSDIGSAERLVRLHGEDFRFNHVDKRWIVWDEKRWAHNTDGAMARFAADVSISFHDEARGLKDKDYNRAISHVMRSRSEYGINAMISLARSLRTVRNEELDANRWLLNVQDGTIDLCSGNMRSHQRDDMITRISPAYFGREARYTQWMNYLDRIFEGNERLMCFLQRVVGYALTGSIREQCFFILYGTGSNGKSTFISTISHLLGDYAASARADILLEKKFDSQPFELAPLQGIRFLSMSETGHGKHFDEGRIKALTGGEKITACFKFGDFFSYDPQFKMFFSTNHKPIIRGTDHAMWRRPHLIPFTVKIPKEEADLDLPEKLKSEIDGIMQWAVQGCLEWQRMGLQPPEEVLSATKEYRESMDWLIGFLTDGCEVGQSYKCERSPLFESYRSWCESNNEGSLGRKQFYEALEERGFRQSKDHGKRFVHGLKVKRGAAGAES